MILTINVIGVALIIITIWFFLVKKKGVAIEVTGEVTILADGGYKPNVISVKKGQPVTLNFLRNDESSCLEEVVIPEFGVRQHLSLNEITPVTITPQKTGEFDFSCGMNMFHGKINVTE